MMTRRDLERWVVDHRAALDAADIGADFGFAPRLDGAEGASWVSFHSARGAGRLVRAGDGAVRVDVHRYRDGSCLLQERHPAAAEAQLSEIVGLLTVPRRDHGRAHNQGEPDA